MKIKICSLLSLLVMVSIIGCKGKSDDEMKAKCILMQQKMLNSYTGTDTEEIK